MKILIALLCCFVFGCHPNEEKGAWAIVKQKGKENYGFVSEMGRGHVLAGFTNKAGAIASMEEHRKSFRRPRTPAKPKDDSMWEAVK